MWKTCQVKCGGLCRISLDGRPCLPVCMACGAVQVEASPGGGWMGFFTCMTRWLWCWVADGSFFRLPCCQVQCEGGSGTPAYGGDRLSRRSRSGCMLSAQIPPQRGGAEISGFTSLGRTGARTRSGPHTKRARLSASLVRGWIFGRLRASEKSLYIRHGPKMSLTGTGSVFPRVRLDLMAWKLAYLFARCCSPAKNWKVLPFYPEETAPGDMDIRQVSFSETCKEALGLLAVQGSQERAEGKLMIDESC